MPMVRIQQLTSRDCAVAALATVTGQMYESVRAWFHRIDFNEHGAHLPGVEQFLSEHCYWYRKVSKYPGVMGAPPRTNWPCKPFTNRHICLVDVAMNSPCHHWVCMDEWGRVLDPLTADEKQLGDYHDVLNIIGVMPNSLACFECHRPVVDGFCVNPDCDLSHTEPE